MLSLGFYRHPACENQMKIQLSFYCSKIEFLGNLDDFISIYMDRISYHVLCNDQFNNCKQEYCSIFDRVTLMRRYRILTLYYLLFDF